jgi:UDP-N-acetyl-D-mannosaminuronate dehydrogenase
VVPGEHDLASITDMWRVSAGLTPAKRFLSSFIDVRQRLLKRLANIRNAELPKVLENTNRPVNIAPISRAPRSSYNFLLVELKHPKNKS